MAEDTSDQADLLDGLEEKPSVTAELQIHGYHQDAASFGVFERYGADAPRLRDLIRQDPELGKVLDPRLPICRGEVVWAVRHEMALTVDDFLSRRTRALVWDARAAKKMAPRVARLMAKELGRDEAWPAKQVEAFEALADQYLP